MTERAPQTDERARTQEAVDALAMRAALDPDIQRAVASAEGKLSAVAAVRPLIRERYPGVSGIPVAHPEVAQGSAEFKVAKAVVDALWER